MKKAISIFLILTFVALFFTACGKSKLPDVDTVSQYSDEQLWDLAKTVNEKTLTDSWGEPVVIGNERLWPLDLTGHEKYMVAYIEGGKVISLNVSKTMFITAVKGENGVMYCIFGWNDYSTDVTNLAFMPTQDRFGNEISCESGDQILFESDGMVAETYPAQLAPPYSFKIMGHLSDSEVEVIADSIELP